MTDPTQAAPQKRNRWNSTYATCPNCKWDHDTEGEEQPIYCHGCHQPFYEAAPPEAATQPVIPERWKHVYRNHIDGPALDECIEQLGAAEAERDANKRAANVNYRLSELMRKERDTAEAELSLSRTALAEALDAMDAVAHYFWEPPDDGKPVWNEGEVQDFVTNALASAQKQLQSVTAIPAIMRVQRRLPDYFNLKPGYRWSVDCNAWIKEAE